MHLVLHFLIMQQLNYDVHEFFCAYLNMERITTFLHRHIKNNQSQEDDLWITRGKLFLQKFGSLLGPKWIEKGSCTYMSALELISFMIAVLLSALGALKSLDVAYSIS